jgi:phosphoribosylamine--glycine ligase
MRKASVPTADYRTFDDRLQALAHVQQRAYPLVIKATGLALGKGVFVCHTLDEARDAIEKLMRQRLFGEAGSEVVVEDYLDGPESVSRR